MEGYSDYRDNPLNWSLPLGRVFGIRIRLHLFFIVFIIIQLLRAEEGMVGVWAVILGVLFAVVLLHEFGHCAGARSVGGHAEQIMIWPLGGLAYVDAPMLPKPQFIVSVAGPLVNVVLCLLTGLVLLLLGGQDRIIFNPFHLLQVSISISSWSLVDWLHVLWSVNYMLLLFNLLPIFPLDGGQILRTILWHLWDFKQATLSATFIGMVGAIVLGVIGMVDDSNPMLVFIAVFGFITCYRDRQMLKAGMLQDDHEFGYDFSKGYRAFEGERPKPSWLQRRRATRRARKAEQDRARQRDWEQQIDALLEKVHREGIQALSRREKRILETETERRKHH